MNGCYWTTRVGLGALGFSAPLAAGAGRVRSMSEFTSMSFAP